ncbi:dihydrodipicolinate synthase family protein [Jiangella asiatica]|uniref:Dihydrodipicolinate synthase family protein n=1 Tax=Jiangella asiatica TaxID=2530372 RepID=A0A4R5D555_9ACTN|nr:dihydrodipicolinate synthase family protein [Jiangella asiatica]TDE08562.1 dihydrodipicolinate synthase family protein [Jiangella asiatica]
MANSRDVAELTGRLRWSLVAAAATPMRSEGTTDADVCDAYFRHLVRSGANALAVAAHTGRGAWLDVGTKVELVRRAAAIGVPVVAGVGGSTDGEAADLEWAGAAAGAGADALLVVPPADLDADAVVAHYDLVWETSGLPLVAFDLYSHPFPATVLARVLEHPGVAAFKPARLYDAVACQEGIAAARARGRLVLTGEDRMLGASLMWGAEGALVGIAAAAVQVTVAAVETFASAVHTSARDAAARFLEVSAIVDELARVTFRPPYDGYVQRMLWLAADEGAIPDEYAVDPYRPAELDDAERDEVVRVVRQCLDQVRR